MIGLLHGYHLEGSGSNHWTRYLARELCRQGRDFLLICQEEHPQHYDFIKAARQINLDGSDLPLFQQKTTSYSGQCLFYRPQLPGQLPVFVGNLRIDNSPTLPMPKMTENEIQAYLKANFNALSQLHQLHGFTAFLANHAVLQSAVAYQMLQKHGVPYALYPHGSALEYVIKKDPRFFKLADPAFASAQIIFYAGEEIKHRVLQIFPKLKTSSVKFIQMPLGVDLSYFKPVIGQNREENIKKLIKKTKTLLASSKSNKLPDKLAPKYLSEMNWQEETILLHVGALIEKKGLSPLLKAMPQLIKDNPLTRLLIVGRGADRESFEAEWKQRVKDNSFIQEDRVLFLGYFPHDLLKELYPCVDLSVFPSLIPEVGPLVFLESLSCSCPAMGTNMGGMQGFMDIMEQEISPQLMELFRLNPDPEKLSNDLAKKIPQALKTVQKIRPLLRPLTEKHFSWSQITHDFWNNLSGRLIRK